MVDILALIVGFLSKFKLPLNIEYKKNKIELVLRIETNKFNICESVPIRRKIFGILPYVSMVHRTANDNWSVLDLK